MLACSSSYQRSFAVSSAPKKVSTAIFNSKNRLCVKTDFRFCRWSAQRSCVKSIAWYCTNRLSSFVSVSRYAHRQLKSAASLSTHVHCWSDYTRRWQHTHAYERASRSSSCCASYHSTLTPQQQYTTTLFYTAPLPLDCTTAALLHYCAFELIHIYW
jgi:hypothetical protein